MKWLIILALILFLIMIIAIRFRRQINAAIQIFQMIRQMRNLNKPEKRIEKKIESKSVPLVRCARCGTWTPQNAALNLRSKIFYCSTNCMEQAVRVSS